MLKIINQMITSSPGCKLQDTVTSIFIHCTETSCRERKSKKFLKEQS